MSPACILVFLRLEQPSLFINASQANILMEDTPHITISEANLPMEST